MGVCVLSANEAGRLEHYGIWPQCKNHLHVNKRSAAARVTEGACRHVGGEGAEVGEQASMITLNRVTIWQPVQAHMEDGRAVIGLRTWGLKARR